MKYLAIVFMVIWSIIVFTAYYIGIKMMVMGFAFIFTLIAATPSGVGSFFVMLICIFFFIMFMAIFLTLMIPLNMASRMLRGMVAALNPKISAAVEYVVAPVFVYMVELNFQNRQLFEGLDEYMWIIFIVTLVIYYFAQKLYDMIWRKYGFERGITKARRH